MSQENHSGYSGNGGGAIGQNGAFGRDNSNPSISDIDRDKTPFKNQESNERPKDPYNFTFYNEKNEESKPVEIKAETIQKVKRPAD